MKIVYYLCLMFLAVLIGNLGSRVYRQSIEIDSLKKQVAELQIEDGFKK